MSLRKNRKHTAFKPPVRRVPDKCWACGKLVFLSRKDARRQSAVLPSEADRYRPRAYECVTNPGAWHVGHLPEDVIRGDVSRQHVRESMRRRDEERG